MRLSPLILVAVLASVGLFAFQNCAKSDFVMEGKSTSSLGGDDDTGGGSSDVDVIAANCNSASIKTLTHNVYFPTPANLSGSNSACAWGENGNLTERDTYVQARSEQYVDIPVPAGATICSMKFDFDDQEMLYDDEIILTYKNAVLATSYKGLIELLPKKDGLYMYGWDALKGKASNVSGYNPYCAGQEEGKASCSMPETQKTGRINATIDKEIFYRIAAKTQTASQRFGFITTGDNDRTSDCKHAPIGFDVEIKYYQ